MDAINTHIARHRAATSPKSSGYVVVPQIICADGFRLSVQGSESHYSSPRNNDGPYTALEVGFPTYADGRPYRAPKSWGRSSGGPVCGWVPLESILRLVRKHGGVVFASPEVVGVAK